MHPAVAAVVAGWLAVLAGWDAATRRLPDRLTLPGAVLALGGAAVGGRGTAALLGAVALAGLYLAVHLASRAAMGAGDVKLALGTGALTGAVGVDAWLLAALAAPLLTGGWAVVALVRGRHTVPHGPAMCVATALALLPAGQVVAW